MFDVDPPLLLYVFAPLPPCFLISRSLSICSSALMLTSLGFLSIIAILLNVFYLCAIIIFLCSLCIAVCLFLICKLFCILLKCSL